MSCARWNTAIPSAAGPSRSPAGTAASWGRWRNSNIQVAHPHTGRIEDLHMVVMHMIGYYFMEEERPHQKS